MIKFAIESMASLPVRGSFSGLDILFFFGLVIAKRANSAKV